MDWRERITTDPAILVGKPIVRGARIAVKFAERRNRPGPYLEYPLFRVRSALE